MHERTAAASTHSVAVAVLRHRHCSSWQCSSWHCSSSGFLVAEAGQLQHDPAIFTEDLLVAPASQAFVERVFSLCGLLTTLHNRMSHSLEMRAFHKLNCIYVLNRHCCYCNLSVDMNIVILSFCWWWRWWWKVTCSITHSIDIDIQYCHVNIIIINITEMF